jgi:hypothetical protein
LCPLRVLSRSLSSSQLFSRFTLDVAPDAVVHTAILCVAVAGHACCAIGICTRAFPSAEPADESSWSCELKKTGASVPGPPTTSIGGPGNTSCALARSDPDGSLRFVRHAGACHSAFQVETRARSGAQDTTTISTFERNGSLSCESDAIARTQAKRIAFRGARNKLCDCIVSRRAL